MFRQVVKTGNASDLCIAVFACTSSREIAMPWLHIVALTDAVSRSVTLSPLPLYGASGAYGNAGL